jgi:hypothetical protein
MTHDAVYKWFTDAFMLRVEDEYKSGGSTYGAYADAFGMEPTRGAASCAGRDLGDFVEAATRQSLLPPWWDMHDFLDYASRVVGLAVEASDMREKHGNFGVAALRSLAVRITGGKPGTDAGLGGPAFGEDEEDWDEDEDEFDEWNADEEGGAEDELDYDAQWDKGDDDDDADLTAASREARLLERWAGLGAQSAEQAGSFKAACAAAQRTPARVIMLAGLDYIYSDDEAQAQAFNAMCDEMQVQCLLQATAPPGKPDLIEACTQTVLAALPRAACLLVLQAEAAGAGRVLPQLRGALRAWVHAGGVLAMNGGEDISRQDALTLLRALFPDETAGWDIICYRHPSLPEDDDQAALNERCHVLQTQSPPALQPRISANAPWLVGVPLSQRLYTYKHANAEEEGCTVAVADHGDGRIIYFGDYAGGYYPCIARAVISLATHCPTPSSAAAPAKR